MAVFRVEKNKGYGKAFKAQTRPCEAGRTL